jgi:flagellar hook-associated protein 2
MDTDELVKKLIQAQRAPLDKYAKAKQMLEWKQQDYRNMNTKLMEFRTSAFNMTLSQPYSARKISLTNESVATVSAGTNTNEGTYTLKVKQLAQAASLTSGKLGAKELAAGVKEPGAVTLAELDSDIGNTSLTVSGEKGTATISVTGATKVSDLVAMINSRSAATGVKASYDSNLDALFFSSSTTGANAKVGLTSESSDLLTALQVTGGDYEMYSGDPDKVFVNEGLAADAKQLIDKTITGTQNFIIKGLEEDHSFNITKNTTIGGLITEINDKLASKGVTAALDVTGHLVVHNSSGEQLTFGGDGLAAVGFEGGEVSATPGYAQSGKNASVEFNGVKGEYSSNTFTVNGMTISAKNEDESVTTTITVTQDADAIYESVKSFVDKYNQLVSDVNSVLSELKYKDFEPLTAEQKADMSEDEIKKWEEKAMSGTLRHDSLLNSGMLAFRNAFAGIVSGLPSGQLKNLGEIGISATLVKDGVVTGYQDENGKLYIDEAKLKKAITERPDEIKALFTADDNIKNSSAGDGIATRLYQAADTVMRQITERAGNSDMVEDNYTMGKESRRIDDEITRLTLRLEAMETRYYNQFSAMENYLNQMNSQSAWLSQQFA